MGTKCNNAQTAGYRCTKGIPLISRNRIPVWLGIVAFIFSIPGAELKAQDPTSKDVSSRHDPL